MTDFLTTLSLEERKLAQIIEPLLDGEGFELVKIRLNRGHGKAVLGLFIDKKDEENAIQLEHLTDISRFLSDVLDAETAQENLLAGQYDLEVSSPGLNRPLTKKAHFDRALHKKVKVRLIHEEAGSRNFSGVIGKVLEDGIEVETSTGKEPIYIKFGDIFDAHIVFDFDSLKGQKKVNK